MKILFLRRINFTKLSLWKQLLLVLLLILIIIRMFRYSSKYQYGQCLDEKLKLEHLLAQKSHEVLRLKAVLKKFEIPSSNYEAADLPIIHVITPTYSRILQKAELTKFKNVLLHIPSVHWIVVEDATKKSRKLSSFLKTSGINYTHLTEETPPHLKLANNLPRYYKHRGVYQRNRGIKWLHSNDFDPNGIVYFADDDNLYTIELFHEMRKTKKVGVWPVGLVGGVKSEQPIVEGDKVIGWDVGWGMDRTFATDMAGFSINLGLLLEKRAVFVDNSKIGFLETDFLLQIVSLDELEPLADDCSKVLVWHTNAQKPNLKNEQKRFYKTNIEV